MAIMDNAGIFNRSLDELRMEPRNAKHENSTAEDTAINDRDHAVRQMVERHEDHLIAQAEHAVTTGSAAIERAHETLRDLERLEADLRNGAHPNRDIADRFETLRRRAERELRAVAASERTAASIGTRLDDPYGSLDRLRKKYPAVIAGRELT